ncbi:hypothetical protein D081_2394 [Anaerovibrio sp. JC8]|uniref:hypothetical protein n=1 Tax=Anaerovibrio sp. JC8 TaxID=1240085 RepID=UPI000A0A11F5|nr:hypothetical protein [Anaerovibrio sp. JC8]ORT98768.1 hypothetical protein D081_2394 [Anaerovibrio sp. JC8]
MKLARFLVALSVLALLFTGCGSQASNQPSNDNSKEVPQQTQESSSSSRPSHEAKYQPLPKDFDHEKYNITGFNYLETKKAKRQVDNGIYVPKKRIDFKTLDDSIWMIQKVIASDYCIEVRAVRSNGIDKGRNFTWFLYDNASFYGSQQNIVSLGGYDVKEFIPEQLQGTREGANESIALVAAHKVFNQYGANYKDNVKYDMVINEY